MTNGSVVNSFTKRVRRLSISIPIYKHVDMFKIYGTCLINMKYWIMFELTRLDPNNIVKKKK